MIEAHIRLSIAAKHAILADIGLLAQVEVVASRCVESLAQGGKLIFAGNGGSFADAQHLTAEFTSRYLINRRALPAVALGCNSSSMSAIGNDFGFDYVFARELEALAKPEDVFFPISTSGKSPNILNAIAVASQMGLSIYGFTGKDGGAMASACTCLCMPSDVTGIIQECHIMIGHIICHLIETRVFAS